MADDRPSDGGSPARRYYERTATSRELYERARGSMPGGNSRGVLYYEPYPAYVEAASGCRLTDVDGNEYVDFLNNYTSLIHGHAPDDVVEAATEAARAGTAPGAPTRAEIDWAEHLVDRAPAVDLVRFTNSGTEATMHAIRAARAYTGNDTIAKFEGVYHGTHDDAQISVHPPARLAGARERPNSVPDSAGVPESKREEVLTLPFNDGEATRALLEAHRGECAGVIVAPVMGSAVVPGDETFLEELAAYCDDHDVPLIFDEVISLRLAYGGAHAAYDLEPDLVAYGKLIGGGFPVGAFGGREALMAPYDPRGGSSIVHSGTFNANPVTAAAGLAALRRFDADAVDRLDALGEQLVRGVRESAAERGVDLQVNRAKSLFNVYLSDGPVGSYRDEPGDVAELRHMLFLELLDEGVRLAPKLMGSLSTPMTETEVGTFVSAFGAALDRLKPEFEARAPHLISA
jgi:glutamate-1-semialdehyde 2,1-aminomutase